MVTFFGNFFCILYFGFIVQAQISELPLIAMKTAKDQYELPKCVRGTSNELEFYLPGQKSEIVYFCPKSSTNYLLYPTAKHKCKIEPTPRIRRATDEESQNTNCPNIEDAYSLYTFGYQVVYFKKFKEKEEHWDAWVEMYTFCFDHSKEKISYISYTISSPELLASDLLENQRHYVDKKYELDHFDDPIIKKYVRRIQDRYMQYDKHVPSSEERQATIAAPFDMALAIWKKPFLHIINYNIFHHPLIAVQWVKINLFVRKLAIEGWGELHVKVGMENHDFGNLYKIWWKLVITTDESFAIAIILHDMNLAEEPETKLGFECLTRCDQFGFEEIVDPYTSSLVYCCHPDVITSAKGLKSYGLFDLRLNNILKPPPVKCNPDSSS